MKTNRQTVAGEGNKPMNTHRQAAVIIGVLFIIATVTAILGLLLYQPILTGPDYLVNGFENQNQVILGVIMELILVLSAVGTAVGLFPIVKKYNESIALGYLFFRIFEAVLITIGIVSVLALLTLSRNFAAAPAPDASAFYASGTLLLAVHDWTFVLGPHFMLGVNTLLYSYLLYKSKLVPRWISTLGLFGSTIIFIVALFEMFGAIQPSLVLPLALPVAIYEMVLAGWLIVKGFNSSTITAGTVKTEPSELLSAAKMGNDVLSKCNFVKQGESNDH